MVTSSSFERRVGREEGRETATKRREEEGRVTASKRNKFGDEGARSGWDGMGKVEPLTRVRAEAKT